MIVDWVLCYLCLTHRIHNHRSKERGCRFALPVFHSIHFYNKVRGLFLLIWAWSEIKSWWIRLTVIFFAWFKYRLNTRLRQGHSLHERPRLVLFASCIINLCGSL